MTTTLATTAQLDLGPGIEIRTGCAFDPRDIRETTTGQSWDDSTHVHRTGDHWTITFADDVKRYVNQGEGLLRDLDTMYVYKIKLVKRFLKKFPERVRFHGYYVGDVAAEVRGDHTGLGAAVKALVEKLGIPAWFLADHSNFTEEVWEAVLDGVIEPTLATACEMLAAIHEQEGLRDWEPRGTVFPPDPFLDEDDSDEPYAVIGAVERGITKRVNHLCKQAGMDIADLADAAEIDFNDLYFILNGQAAWSIAEVAAVAEALGMALSELFRQAQILADEEAN